ncbi:MAG: hypothetical protein WHV67_06175 [Thermoanaerobaculia bacterium]
MLNDLDLEKLERQYFDFILIHLKQDLNHIIKGLNSRIKILNNWFDQFKKTARKGYKSSDLDIGAERIFHNFFAPILKFPNSCPIGSDLMFELPDSFVHIEIKTALIDNPADYKGKVNIGINQTSYCIENDFKSNLPFYYKMENNIEKPCLTYVIQIIHEYAKSDIKCLLLISIPNGQLYSQYKKEIFKSGKAGYAKAKDFRFTYRSNPLFKILSDHYNEKKYRVEIVFISKEIHQKEITNLNEIPVHFKS